MKAIEIIESFDSKIPLTISDTGNSAFEISGIIGNRTIIFVADRCVGNDKQWEISFYETNHNTSEYNYSYNSTGSGNQMQVFSFIFECIKKFINEHHPDIIVFSASKFEKSRLKLYKNLITKIKIPGYKFVGITDDRDETHPAYEEIFTFVRSDK